MMVQSDDEKGGKGSKFLQSLLLLLTIFAIMSATIMYSNQYHHENHYSTKIGKEAINRKSTSVKSNEDELDRWLEETFIKTKLKRDRYRKVLESLDSNQLPSWDQEINYSLIRPGIDLSDHRNISNTDIKEKENDPKIQNASTRLHAVTYASHGGRDDRFCRAVESCIRHNIDITILGWNTPWKGLSQKLEAAYDYSKSLPSDDVILFTDAFDVLYSQSPEIILNDFLQFKASILFSAECGCWPHVSIDPEICLSDYPKSPTPYRYLNSGAWMGYAKQASEMLKVVIKGAGKDFDNANDQKLIADLYINGRFDIRLDFESKIFQAMHMTLDPPLSTCNPHQDITLKANKEKMSWFNKRTNSNPAVIHFNGGGKRYHLEMEQKMWYKSSQFNSRKHQDWLKNYEVRVPNSKFGKLTFNSICPNYVDKEYAANLYVKN